MLLLSLGVAVGSLLAVNSQQPHTSRVIEWLENPRPVDRFELAGSDGVFDNTSLVGQWTFVLFGFLNCPDVCPLSLSELSALNAHMEDLSRIGEVAFLFVSVDPQRDSPEELGRYVRHFSTSIQGVTGEEAQLESLADSLGVAFEVSPGAEDYAVAHSTTFSIIDPSGALRARFRPGFDPANLAREFVSGPGS